MKKTLTTTALGAVLTFASLGSAFAAEVPAQSIGQLAATAIKVKATSNLDETSKEKVKAIFEQMQKGTLTKEQAKAQLQELGVDVEFGIKGDHDGIKFKLGKVNSVNLDDATKEKVKAILEQAQAGSLTKEQVKAQLQELGIDMDVDFSKATHGVMVSAAKLDNLDEAAKEKVKAILEQMRTGALTNEQVKSQLQELGIDMDVDFSKGHYFQVKMDKSKMDTLDEATKEKVKSILDQMKAGTLTEEQVKAQLQELGINIEVKSGMVNGMTKDGNKVMKVVKFDDAAAQQKM
ncbi:hypothetical protein M5X00_12865 [Paenibacillus alvei]|uniref:hypothetical protein n=2 Tax=Paenibacillus alvei TaxID=44250 RepID=UPI0021CEDA2D|nr:hypothetical protein [Paenibacillus alvei]MCY7487868.1 hypothetical protein [Paenibacillus alvei]MCY9539454.1 hypothetical protein [Paenibacillus alvei]MCY9703900.1 hypothetical protein [Paenibacillus alvei]MCY9733899.1 hypothetical protein [Paenibacillus alvei]MCY9755131.1 hypothetical protein [Paenibacillus alvei]